MKYQYFISSRWRNKEQVLKLTQKLRAKGKIVYCFAEDKSYIDEVDPNPESFMQHFESLPNWTQNPMVQEIFKTDMEGLKESEQLILLLPAGKSSHLETGIAYGMGKKCIVIGEQKEAESLYLIFSEFYNSTEDFLNSL